MKWQIKAEIAGEKGRKTTIELPVSDDGMARALCRLLQGPLDTQVTITGIEPEELASLCGEGRDLDELNYLAKRMDDSMTSEQGSVYNLNTTVYPVTISAGKTANVNNGSAVVNMWKDGYVKVTKQNENGAGLAGVIFGVYSDSNCSTLVTKITTGSDGVGTSAAIDTGTTGTRSLYVKELSMTAEQNKVYKMNTTVYPITISAGKTIAVNNGNAVVNDWLPGKISVTKEISSGAKLSGASFTAYTDKDCKTVLTDMAGKNVVITTDKNGTATSSEIYVGKTGTRTVYVRETVGRGRRAEPRRSAG